MSHCSQDELTKTVNQANKLVKVGEIYRHYKDSNLKYEIKEIGIFEETEQPCVVYQALYGDKILWIRTLENFTEFIEIDRKKVRRFIKVN